MVVVVDPVSAVVDTGVDVEVVWLPAPIAMVLLVVVLSADSVVCVVDVVDVELSGASSPVTPPHAVAKRVRATTIEIDLRTARSYFDLPLKSANTPSISLPLLLEPSECSPAGRGDRTNDGCMRTMVDRRS